MKCILLLNFLRASIDVWCPIGLLLADNLFFAENLTSLGYFLKCLNLWTYLWYPNTFFILHDHGLFFGRECFRNFFHQYGLLYETLWNVVFSSWRLAVSLNAFISELNYFQQHVRRTFFPELKLWWNVVSKILSSKWKVWRIFDTKYFCSTGGCFIFSGL